MTDETFLRRAKEEDSQSIAAGAMPVGRCPACESTDVGFNAEHNHRRFYCRNCTTTWSPEIITRVLGERDLASAQMEAHNQHHE